MPNARRRRPLEVHPRDYVSSARGPTRQHAGCGNVVAMTTNKTWSKDNTWRLILGLTCGVALALALDNWLFVGAGIALALALGWRIHRPGSEERDGDNPAR